MDKPWFWAAAGIALGLVVGSFLATLVVRWPRGRGLGGRSACDACGASLRAAELVPLVSALVQRGRCRRCGARIVPVHTQMELACALVGGLALGLHGAAGLAGALMGWMLVALALLDLRHWWLPDRLTAPLLAMGLVLGHDSFVQRLAGALAAALGLGILAWAYFLARGREGLGAGDIKLASALGAWVALPQLPLVLLGASAAGLAWAVAARRRANAALPLGLLLAPAGWLLWLTHG